MAYIGNSPANVGNYQVVDSFGSFNGSTTTFALAAGGASITPAKSAQLLVNINGVMQQPDDSGSSGFRVVGSNIVFSSAPANGDESWAVYQGQNVDVGTPSDDTVGLAQLTASGTASNTTFLRGDNAWAVVDTNLVADTSPQLGGNLDLNSKNITGTGGIPAANLTGNIASARLTSVPAGNLTGSVAAARLTVATTQAESDNSTKLATTAYVTSKITTLIGGAPSTLNDLNELAEAINDDDNYNSTLTTALGTKLPKAGGTMTGNIVMGSNLVDGVDISARDSVLTSTTTTANAAMPKSGGAFTGNITTNGLIDTRDVAADGVLATNALPKAGGTLTGALNITAGSGSNYLNITNSTASDSSGNRYNKLLFKGKQSGNEVTSLAHIVADHDGSADDQKGNLHLKTNDGNDGDSPTTRMTIKSTGNVGIGTTSPVSLLNVALPNSTTAPIITFERGDAAVRGEIKYDDTNAVRGFEIGTTTSHDFSLKTAGNKILSITYGGNVGIGTTSPDTALNVAGYIRGEAGSTPKLQLKRTGNAAGNGYIECLGSDDSVDYKIAFAQAAGKMQFSTATANALTIDGSGNVGIGISAPLDILHLNDPNDDCVLNLDTATANKNSLIKFSDPDAQGRAFLQYAHSNDSFRINIAGAERVYVHSNGVTSIPAGVALGIAANANTASNVLDDYEIGTWIPTITCSSSGSYTLDTGANLAAYTKTGRVVHIQGGISVASANSPSGTIRMSLPFTAFTSAKDTDYSLGSCTLDGAGGTIDNGIYIFAFGTAYVQFPMVSDSGNFSYLTNGHVDAAWALKFSFSYIAV